MASRRIRQVSAILAIATLTLPSAALTCSCEQPTAEKAFARSSAVFAGTVIDVDKQFWAWLGLSNSGGYEVTFQVTKRWKGSAATTETVRTRLTGEACGFPFQMGGAYLVYVAPGPAEDLQTGMCSGTRDLAGANADVLLLDELAASESPAP
jgi:hypothetical protein